MKLTMLCFKQKTATVDRTFHDSKAWGLFTERQVQLERATEFLKQLQVKEWTDSSDWQVNKHTFIRVRYMCRRWSKNFTLFNTLVLLNKLIIWSVPDSSWAQSSGYHSFAEL